MVNRIQMWLIFFVIPLVAFFVYLYQQNITLKEFFFYTDTPIIHIGDFPVRVEIVRTALDRERGLSGRTEIGEHHSGMLFVFPEADYHGIWMKDMKFPIDIIWISEDMKVVGITKDVDPNTYPYVFRPPQPVKYLVETEVHYAETVGISVGNEVRIPLEELQ